MNLKLENETVSVSYLKSNQVCFSLWCRIYKTRKPLRTPQRHSTAQRWREDCAFWNDKVTTLSQKQHDIQWLFLSPQIEVPNDGWCDLFLRCQHTWAKDSHGAMAEILDGESHAVASEHMVTAVGFLGSLKKQNACWVCVKHVRKKSKSCLTLLNTKAERNGDPFSKFLKNKKYLCFRKLN